MTAPHEEMAEVAEAIRRHRSFVLTTHVRPDGDACGSSLAMLYALRRLGKHVCLATQDDMPPRYGFLPGYRDVGPAIPVEKALEFDCAIALDCDGLGRTGTMRPVFEAVGTIIDIDHHEGLKAFGDARLVVPEASCTGELVYHLLRPLGVPLDADLATCLLCAVMYDTGSFRHTNTTPGALRMAADLMEAGADPHSVGFHVFDDTPFAQLALRGRVLSTAHLALGDRVVIATALREHFERTGALPADTEGIVDDLRSVSGIDVAVLIVEMTDGMSKVSLRAVRDVDVAAVMATFGGGGHRRAAGCEIAGGADAVGEVVLDALAPVLGDEVSA